MTTPWTLDDGQVGRAGQITSPSRQDDPDLHALFGRSKAVFALLAGPDHVLEAANPAYFEAIGLDRVRLGVPLVQSMPELEEQGFVAQLDGVYRTGVPLTAREARILIGDGVQVREAFYDYNYEPRRGAGGDIVGVAMLGTETTAARQGRQLADDQRALLEQIAREAPLEKVLDGMVRKIEDLAPGVIASVLLADEEGRHLHHGVGPSLPDFYNEAIDGIAIGEGVGSCGSAAHHRSSMIVTDIATDPLWDDFRDLAERAGLAACWSTPILGRDGRLLGTFAMYHHVPRVPGESDLKLGTTFADIAALAIERHRSEQARMAAEEKERAARADLAFLLEASTVLTRDLDQAEIFQCLADLCVPALAPLSAVDVVESARIHRVATAATMDGHAALLATHVPAHDLGDAVGRVLASGVTEVARRTPVAPGPWDELAVTGYLTVPLKERGDTFGALTLFATAGRPLDGHMVGLAEELARRASVAARNARQYAQRVKLSRDLQAGLLLPDPPQVPGAEIAIHYHPAGEGLEIGGDFYDVFPLGGDRWAFMIGDVCGRGAMAATTTALVRHTARAVARFLPDPASVVEAVNTALQERPADHGTGFVTLVYGHLRHDGGRLAIELVRAGHVLPRLLDAEGAVRRIGARGFLLGVMPRLELETCHLDLTPGQSLVLVTDGITETRSPDGGLFDDEGLDGTLAALPHGTPARTVLEAVTSAVRDYVPGQAIDDDQAILVLTAITP
ncbi:SpoIIE family protein phosphatase [Planotetraspora sp. A-T 1434]|uniref:SpoIIE family protein phosphatase n=1 Tax=Planotetraspora sp. A-T 1434 TaxID=2979219 RepID=UPI0021C120B8|nr:SpoIIE family protein phosphatase [Planotetraspora sp. A-T 1434]MCT9934883.1 SpoIIE family protein phosphatase [Planotetraspora sp. A-T 1434]